MATTAEKRRANRARRLIRSESRWLQKAIFALSKAEDVREKIDDLTDDDRYALTMDFGGKEHQVSEVGTALRAVIEERLEAQRLELRDRMRMR